MQARFLPVLLATCLLPLSVPARAEEGDEPKAAEAAPPQKDARADPRCNVEFYTGVLNDDARTFGLPAPPLEAIGEPIAGGVEFSGRQVLSLAPAESRPRKKRRKGAPEEGAPRPSVMETRHLRLELGVQALVPEGAPSARDHLVLSITNKTAQPLAYRVLTEVGNPAACAHKAELAHNAVALDANETTRRTECLQGDRQELAVQRVEVYEVMPFSQRYLSRLNPFAGPFDMRVAAGHNHADLPSCPVVPHRAGEKLPEDLWHRLVDYYARHNCDQYTMPEDYQPWKETKALPVCNKRGFFDVSPVVAAPEEPRKEPFPWLLVAAGGLAAVLGVLLYRRRRRQKAAEEAERERLLKEHAKGKAKVLEMKDLPDYIK